MDHFLYIIRCLKEGDKYFQLGYIVDAESETYFDCKFLDRSILTLVKDEEEFCNVNWIDLKNKLSWHEVTDEQIAIINFYKNEEMKYKF